jgi:hypothetical protein
MLLQRLHVIFKNNIVPFAGMCTNKLLEDLVEILAFEPIE